MNNIDSIFKATLAKIEEEKAEAIKQESLFRQKNKELHGEIRKSMKCLSETAMKALESGEEFLQFMLKKRISNPYSCREYRIIISNFNSLDVKGYDLRVEKHFRIHIIFKTDSLEPKNLTHLRDFEISCGYWWFCGGMLHVDEEIPSAPHLLRFIQEIKDTEKLIETCTRSNT